MESRFVNQFIAIIKQQFVFHCCMLSLLLFELISFIFFLNASPKSYYIAIVLALFLVSIFCYFIFYSYLQLKKPEQIKSLTDAHILALKEEIGDESDHFAMAKSLFRTSNEIAKEQTIFPYPFHAMLIRERVSMQESLLQLGIHEYHQMIKKNPTDLKCHTALVNSYLTLSKINPSHKHSAIKMAIEELKILDDYAPNDPWVHAHLASAYGEIGMKEEEIKEYEILKNLCPEDSQILCNLGKLYFELGLISKGMRIYEKLKKIDEKSSLTLINAYDARFQKQI
jgi:tetratricopeptide (TPR) repeat protein